MSSNELKIQSRDVSGKAAAKKLRASGIVPAVVYGRKEEPIKVAINAKELRDLVAHHGTHGMLVLKSEDSSIPDAPVIIKALQRHPFKQTVNSVDFLRVSLSEPVTATVTLILEGEPVGVIDGGVLTQAIHELQISALPQNLPEHINVDVSGLIMDGPPLHVRELVLPEGVTALTDGEEAVAVVNHPRVEPIEEEPMTAEQIAEAEAEGVNPQANSEQDTESRSGNKSDTGEKPGNN